MMTGSLMVTLVAAVIVIAVCFLIMAVGLLRGKTFRSCGCSSITYKGEKIKCASCPDKDEEEPSPPGETAAGVDESGS